MIKSFQLFVYITVLTLIALLPAGLPAQSDDEFPEAVGTLTTANLRWEEAHLAYQRGDTRKAMELYLLISKSPYATADTWTNAGTAAYRSGEVGKAVLFYLRALKLDPSDNLARQSLEVIEPATNEGGEAFAEALLSEVFKRVPTVVWVLVAQLLYLVLCYGFVRIIASRSRDDRGHWIAIFCWVGVFFVFTGAMAWASLSPGRSDADAVVIEDRAITRSEPSDESAAKLELPAGTVLELLEEPRSGFIRVQLRDGRSGYISTENIEKI